MQVVITAKETRYSCWPSLQTNTHACAASEHIDWTQTAHRRGGGQYAIDSAFPPRDEGRRNRPRARLELGSAFPTLPTILAAFSIPQQNGKHGSTDGLSEGLEKR